MKQEMTKAELARQLGVSRAYITMICSGKKKPSQKMLAKMKAIMSQQVVNNLVNNSGAIQPPQLQILAGIDGSRTHRGYRLAPTNGFEVREAHRSSSIPPATTHQSDDIKASIAVQTSKQHPLHPTAPTIAVA